MKYLIAIAIACFCTGCLQTMGITRGPGSTTYEIEVKQYIKGQPMDADTKTTKSTDGEQTASGGGNIVINIVPVGDSVVETADDNSAAKEASAETTPTVKVTP